MSSLNKATIMGNVGKQPEIRSMQSGDKVANFSIATTEKWKDKNSGQMKEATEWHNIVVFGNLVNVVEIYVSKGDKLYIEGKIKTRSWEHNGEKKYTTEIVLQGFDSKLIMLGSRGDSSQSQAPQQDDMDDSQIPF